MESKTIAIFDNQIKREYKEAKGIKEMCPSY